jgi:hypothetical protein
MDTTRTAIRARARRQRTLLECAQALAVTAAVTGEAWKINDATAHTGWSTFDRLLTIGLLAVVVGVLVNTLATLFLAAAHERLNRLVYGPYPLTDNDDDHPIFGGAAPRSLSRALLQVEVATSTHAASRAASRAAHLDLSDHFLQAERRWRGYPDGEATFVLADGLVLHFAMGTSEYGSERAQYTLLTADGDQPVTITSLAQLRHLLDARLAGLPLAPERPTGEREDRPEPVAV